METMSIMLVDDEVRFLSTTKKILSKKGYSVYTACSAAEALEKLEKHDIHVVVLDVKMPEMDGNTALKKIKSRYPKIEVIMLTGHATPDSAIDGLRSGAQDYLSKPADINDLVQKVEEAFERRRRIEEKIREASALKKSTEISS